MTARNPKESVIGNLRTGVPGLDAVLGGGLPEYSFNIIAGDPGAGKSTLALQIVFACATPEKPALYFTVLGEPTLKMLRYQQQFDFFAPDKVGSAVQFINLSEEAMKPDTGAVLDRIVAEVERVRPGIVVVDSFRSITRERSADHGNDARALGHFVQRLALHLTTWEVTSFLIGEYQVDEQPNPVFTVADGIVWLSQQSDRSSVVRRLHVIKMRGRAPMPGLHTFRITAEGVHVFPRIPEQQGARSAQTRGRQSTGVPGLDEIMGGGIPVGDVVLVAGPAGSGKTTFATQFLAEANRRGESAVVAVFEEYPEEYLARAQARANGLGEMEREGRLRVIYLRPLDLSVDETLHEILGATNEIRAGRVVIDSLSGFEVALAPAFRDDFRESLYRLVGALTATGITVFMTAEVIGGFTEIRFTNDRVSFITDDVIAQRYVEIDGRLQKVLSVVKMRGSAHDTEFRTYDIGPAGAVVGGPLRDYHAILSGTPDLMLRPSLSGHPGLTPVEGRTLDMLIRLGAATKEILADRMGMQVTATEQVLTRLLALGYAASTDDGRTYRGVAQQ